MTASSSCLQEKGQGETQSHADGAGFPSSSQHRPSRAVLTIYSYWPESVKKGDSFGIRHAVLNGEASTTAEVTPGWDAGAPGMTPAAAQVKKPFQQSRLKTPPIFTRH